ncbi:MAG TPA: fibronectin type III domain-containing protein [Verrucomicrobiae bacterium]
MQNKLKVSLAFNSYPGAVLDETATAILAGMTGNAAFPTPPVPLATVLARQIAFREALAAAANGGTQLTAVKNQARQALLDALDANAMYVQALARYDLAMLLSSGYQAASTNRAQIQLPAPTILGLDNEMSTQLVVRLSPIANAYCYEVQTRTGTNAWQTAGAFTAARKIILPNLTPGMVYNVQARAIGGTTGYSDWSDPSAHIAT